MTQDLASRASALIEHILTRFHETHRSELPGLLAQARALEALGLAAGLSDEIRRTGDLLEQHMFKEEMRLFPMMEQGGNTLIGHLIEDMRIEHVALDLAWSGLQGKLAALAVPAAAAPDLAALAALRQGVDKFTADLLQHAGTEDDQLFVMFAPG